MRLILVRHAETPSNVADVLDTAGTGPGLTARGRLQAAALVGTLRSERVDALHASPQLRARLTAAPLAAALGLPVQLRPGLREIEAGAWEMRGDEAAVNSYIATVFAWADGDLGVRMPGGEDGHTVLQRYDDAVASAVAVAEVPVLVSHGAAIRCWVNARVRDGSAVVARTHRIPNTGVLVLEGSPVQGWTLRSWIDPARLGAPVPQVLPEAVPAAELPLVG
ncbi:putative phosphoglycerate mutase [Kineococcus xinjiangensis]|uniref:Putative phosphoglycerate mutase n=1 Tax=Kineococcus xinjiangensis TaxID=512762 RepID=A0A2S6IEP0_9ACTN|nr:histidine phosphatase family protein [Kineococcus xinjiangensis]PPK92688.1 putative phosphoglycerate mutase [Kineococcus xinjiangensis]